MIPEPGRRSARRAAEVPAPRTVDFLLTYECPSRCAYCFMEQSGTPLTMTLAVVDRAVDWMAQAAQGPVEVVLLGGEPTLQPLLIRRTIRRAREWERRLPVRFLFSMTTNALPLDDSLADQLVKWGVHYMISVGGYGERHDRSRPAPGIESPFSLLQAKLPTLLSRQPQIAARVTVTPDTVSYLAEDLAGITRMGFSHFIVAPATGREWPEEALEQFIAGIVAFARTRGRREGRPFPLISPYDDPDEGRGTWGCGAGRGRYAIDPEGALFACARFAGLTENAKVRLGDVHTGVDAQGPIRDLQDSSYESRPGCLGCHMRERCLGGCPAINFSHSGRVVTPHPDECRFIKAIDEVKRRAFGAN